MRPSALSLRRKTKTENGDARGRRDDSRALSRCLSSLLSFRVTFGRSTSSHLPWSDVRSPFSETDIRLKQGYAVPARKYFNPMCMLNGRRACELARTNMACLASRNLRDTELLSLSYSLDQFYSENVFHAGLLRDMEAKQTAHKFGIGRQHANLD